MPGHGRGPRGHSGGEQCARPRRHVPHHAAGESCADTATRPARPRRGSARRGHTILIVEDELILATGLARLLRRDGHTVDTAANGRLALAQLDERAYDLILCDVRMPELDGPTLYRLLARQQPHLCSRVIFLTGDTLEPATQVFLEQSGAPCLTKPFRIAEARRIIGRTLDGV